MLLAINDPAKSDVVAGKIVLVVAPSTGKWIERSDPAGKSNRPFSPGSAIKAFTIIAATESRINTNFSIHCGASDPTADVYRSCWYRPGHGVVDREKAIAFSCDRWFIKLASGIDWETFAATLNRYGLTGAARRAPESDKERIEAMVGLGEIVRVTPEKLLLAYSAIFNGGYIFEPNKNGDATPARRIRNQASAVEALRRGMRSATTYGTASEIGKNFPALSILSKTGTGIFTDGDESDRNRTVGWYIGLYPSESPTIAVLVFSPNGTGSHDAVPEAVAVWRRLVKDAPRLP